jgi:hypothetical protein
LLFQNSLPCRPSFPYRRSPWTWTWTYQHLVLW